MERVNEKPEAIQIWVEPKGGVQYQGRVQHPGAPPQPPRPGVGLNPPPLTPEGRLENLERQLMQIMQELGSLRKEMKQPRPSTTSPSGTSLNPSQNPPEVELKRLLDQIEVEKQKK